MPLSFSPELLAIVKSFLRAVKPIGLNAECFIKILDFETSWTILLGNVQAFTRLVGWSEENRA